MNIYVCIYMYMYIHIYLHICMYCFMNTNHKQVWEEAGAGPLGPGAVPAGRLLSQTIEFRTTGVPDVGYMYINMYMH